jgi:hypothetical protein
VDATSDPASRRHCSGDTRVTVVAALVVWTSRSLRGRPDSRTLKLTHYREPTRLRTPTPADTGTPVSQSAYEVIETLDREWGPYL